MPGPWEKYQGGQPQGPWSKYQGRQATEQETPGSMLEQLGEATGAAYRGLTNRGVGIIQTADDLTGGHILSGAAREAAQRVTQANRQESARQGLGSAIGEIAADPINWFNPSGGLVAAGAKAGAASALTDASTSDKTAAERAFDALKGGVTGAVAGKVIGKAGKAVDGLYADIQQLLPSAAKSSKELRSAASPLYERFRNSGGTYSAKLADELANIADSSKAQGIAGGDLKPAEQAFNDALDYYTKLRGKALGPDDLQRLDQSIAEDVSRFNRAGEYSYGRVLNELKYALRDRAFNPAKAAGYVTGAPPDAVNDLVKANGLWSQSYKAADIEKILQKALGTQTPSTSIRTGIKNLLANDKKMAGYTDGEKQLLTDAMDRGAIGGLVNLFGGRLTDSLAGGAAGLAAGGPMGGVIGAVAGKAAGGAMADAAGTIQANRLRNALEAMQGGAAPAQVSTLPAVQAVMKKAATVAATTLGAPTDSAPPPPPLETPPPDPADLSALSPSAPALIDRIAKAESGGNPNAKNPKGTASGLFQFTNPTWQSSVAKWGKELGVDLKDKGDPEAQKAVAEKLLEANASQLSRALRREPTDGEQYAAWFLGPVAAAKLVLSQGSSRDAVTLFPRKVVADNRSIFFDGKRPRSVEEVMQILNEKVT